MAKIINRAILSRIFFPFRPSASAATKIDYVLCRPVKMSAGQSDTSITPVHLRARQYLQRIAVQDANGAHSYQDILHRTDRLARLIGQTIGSDRVEQRIGFLCSSNVTYVLAQWACWATGNIGIHFLKHTTRNII